MKERISTDGNCGLSWDDSIITSMTPAPSARCPFEYFHQYDEDVPTRLVSLEPDDIPEDWPVRPIVTLDTTKATYYTDSERWSTKNGKVINHEAN